PGMARIPAVLATGGRGPPTPPMGESLPISPRRGKPRDGALDAEANENAARDVPGRRSACRALLARGRPRNPRRPDYLTVTEAPAPSRAAFALSAASLLTFSRTVF